MSVTLIRHRIAWNDPAIKSFIVPDADRPRLLKKKLLDTVAKFLGRADGIDVVGLTDVYEVVEALRCQVGAETFDRVKWQQWNDRGGYMRGVAVDEEE